MEENNNGYDINELLLDLVYYNLSFKELLDNVDQCLGKINEKEPNAFILKFHESMDSYLKKYEKAKSNIEIKERKNSDKKKVENEKINYIKSRHEYFKTNVEINEYILFKFIIEFMSDVVEKCLNSNEIIQKYLSKIFSDYIIGTIRYYNFILKKYMEEINENKKIIANSLIEIDNLEKIKEKLKKNNMEQYNKLNEKKITLKKQINNQKINEISINNSMNNDKYFINGLKEENKKLYSKLDDKMEELKTLQKKLEKSEENNKDLDTINLMLISNESINEIMFDDYINKTKELNKKITTINSENIVIKNKLSEITIENKDLKKNLDIISSENKDIKNEINKLKKENNDLKNEINKLKKENNDLKNNLDIISKENNEIRNENNDLKKKLDIISKENNDLKNEINRLTVENKNLKNEVNRLKIKNLKSECHIEELYGEINILIMKNEKLDSKVNFLETVMEMNRKQFTEEINELKLKIKSFQDLFDKNKNNNFEKYLMS